MATALPRSRTHGLFTATHSHRSRSAGSIESAEAPIGYWDTAKPTPALLARTRHPSAREAPANGRARPSLCRREVRRPAADAEPFDADEGGWAEFMAAAAGQRPPPAKAYGLAAVPGRDEIAGTGAQIVHLAAVTPGADGAARGSIQPVAGAATTHEFLACEDGPAYRFVRKIADSLMGSVWLAVSCRLDEANQALVDIVPAERVVIKRSFVANVRAGQDKSGRAVREDPLHELRVLRYLTGKHPCLTSLLGAYTDRRPEVAEAEREMFAVLEFVEGGDLFDHITAREGREERRFSEDRIRSIFTDMCSAVVSMHGWGIIHRDLSPENVLLDGAGRAKICDPGQAVDRWAIGPGMVPADPDVLGKNHFRAPELLERQPHDEKADVYSLGVILFLLFFLGMQPPPPERIAAGRLFEDVARYRRTSWAPESARRLMLAMTRRNPSERPSMLDVLACEWMRPAAAALGFPSQEAMVDAARTNLAAGHRVCVGLHQMRLRASKQAADPGATASAFSPAASTATSASGAGARSPTQAAAASADADEDVDMG